MKPIPNKFVPKAVEMIFDYYGLLSAKELAKRIHNECGIEVDARGVRSKAYALGLRGSDNHGYVSITFAAQEIGVHYNTLWSHINRNSYPVKGRGGFRLITLEVFEELKQLYGPSDEACVTMREACKRLSYSDTHLQALIKKGVIRAFKRGSYWRFPVCEIERILSERAKQLSPTNP